MVYNNKYKILILAPFPPNLGGMVSLAVSLANNFTSDGNIVYRLQAGVGFKSLLSLPILFLKFLYFTLKSDVILIVSSSGKSLFMKALPLICIGKILGKRVLLNFVGGMAVDSNKKWNQFHKIPFSLSDKVVLPSNSFKELLLKKINNINYTVIPNIVDIEMFFNSNLKIDTKSPILISIKEMKDYAGHIHLLNIFKKVQSDMPNTILWFVGDGPERKKIKEHARKLKLRNIKMYKPLLKKDLSELMKKANIYIHASKYESFGLVLVEAMASGMPVVAFNMGGIDDIVINERNGFLIDYLDYKNFKKRIIQLAENDQFYYQIQEECILTSKRFNWLSIRKKWYKVFTVN